MSVAGPEGNGVTYTVKELLAKIEGKLDGVIITIGQKADKHDVENLTSRVKALELKQSAASALSSAQRFWIGTVGIGVLGGLGTLVWLASSH